MKLCSSLKKSHTSAECHTDPRPGHSDMSHSCCKTYYSNYKQAVRLSGQYAWLKCQESDNMNISILQHGFLGHVESIYSLYIFQEKAIDNNLYIIIFILYYYYYYIQSKYGSVYSVYLQQEMVNNESSFQEYEL